MTKNGKTVLCEVGVGPVSMSMGRLYWDHPNIQILMFEPHPQYYKDILEAKGNRDNIDIYNVAIGDFDGTTNFCEDTTSSFMDGIASPSIQHHKKTGLKTYAVDVRKISNYDSGQIDALYVDTEGAEWFALKYLVSRPKKIVVEIYNDLATYINPYLKEIERWTKQNGYKRISIKDGDFIYEL